MSTSEFNPYASPATSGSPIAAESANVMELATQGQRFVNMIMDVIATQVISGVAGFVIGMAYATSVIGSGGQITADDEAFLNLIGMLIGLLLAVTYYIVMELTGQRTLGKLVTGTKVVSVRGGKPTAGQIIGRSFARMIPFEAFSFLGGKTPVGWHDSLSNTRVVKVR